MTTPKIDIQVNADTGKAESRLAQLERRTERGVRRMEELEQEMRQVSTNGTNALRRPTRQLEQMAKSTDPAIRKAAELEKEYREVAASVKQAEGAARRLAAAQDAVGKFLGSIGEDVQAKVTGFYTQVKKAGGIVTRFAARFGPAGAAISGFVTAMAAVTGAAFTLSGRFKSRGDALIKQNQPLAMRRAIAHGGFDQQFLALLVEATNVAGGNVDPTDVSELPKVIGEAILDPESEKGRITTQLAKKHGTDLEEFTPEKFMEAIWNIKDDRQRFFISDTLGGGKFAENVELFFEATDNTIERLKGMIRWQHANADAISEAAQATNIYNRMLAGLKGSLTVRFAPAVTEVVKKMQEFVAVLTDWVRFNPLAEHMINLLKNITIGLLNMFTFIAKLIPGASVIAKRKEQFNLEQETRESMEKQADMLRVTREGGISFETDATRLLDAVQGVTAAVQGNNNNIGALASMQEKSLSQILPGIKCLEEGQDRTSDLSARLEADWRATEAKALEALNTGEDFLGPMMAVPKNLGTVILPPGQSPLANLSGAPRPDLLPRQTGGGKIGARPHRKTMFPDLAPAPIELPGTGGLLPSQRKVLEENPPLTNPLAQNDAWYARFWRAIDTSPDEVPTRQTYEKALENVQAQFTFRIEAGATNLDELQQQLDTIIKEIMEDAMRNYDADFVDSLQ